MIDHCDAGLITIAYLIGYNKRVTVTPAWTGQTQPWKKGGRGREREREGGREREGERQAFNTIASLKGQQRSGGREGERET